MEDNITTINVHQSTREKLRKFEIHPREIHEDIILRLMKNQIVAHKELTKK